jgi:hypothetical protein
LPVTNQRLILCLSVAWALRLAFVLAGYPILQERMHLRDDADGYGAIAETIRAGRYDGITRGPVYPAFVAIAGTPVVVKVLQAVLDSATCLFISVLAGRRMFAAWLWALYPFAIWRVAFISKEIVFTFLVAAYVVAQLTALRDAAWWKWIVAGALLGLANLCKPTLLLWPVAVLFFAPRRAWVVPVTVMLVVAPWTARNWRVTGGEFVPVATERGGVTTFIGNYQPTLGAWEGAGKSVWQAAVARIEERNAGRTEVARDRAFYRAAWEHVAGNPLKALELATRKCWRFWFVSAAQRERVASFVIQAAWLALAGIGACRLGPWTAKTKLLVALTGYVMAVHALSYADLRFSLPVMPLVCVLAASAWGKTRIDPESVRG